MPTLTDYLLSSFAGAGAGIWVQLVNNATGATFVSQASSDPSGKFTVSNVPAGSYTLSQGPSSTGPWTVQSSNYTVGDTPGWFNVKDYGAVGNGVADDTVAIQAAETAAAVNGGTVYFPPGTYMAQGIVKQSLVDWQGAGIGASQVKLKSSASTGVPLVIGANFATLTGTSSIAGINSFTIRGLTFDGNQVNNVSHAVPLLQFYGYGWRMHNFVVQNTGNVGLYSEWAPDASGPVTNPGLEAHVSDFAFINCFSTGIQWNGPHDSILGDGQVENSRLHGVHLMSRGGATQFRNVHCWGGASDWSWWLEDSCYLFQCEGEDGTAGAMWIRTTGQVQVIGGRYFLAPIGIRLGVTAGAAATRVRTVGALISSCSSAAFDLQNDGGNNALDFYTEGGNGAIFTGTMAGTTYVSDPIGVSGFEVRSNAGNGANLSLVGDGSNPAKTIRAKGGQLQVQNNAYNASIWTLDDSGNFYLGASLNHKDELLTFSATPAPNLNNGSQKRMVLTGNITVGVPTGNAIVAGTTLILMWTQDGTGGRTIAYNAIFKTGGGAAIVTTLSTTTIDTFQFDGTSWRLISRITGQ